MKRIAYRTSINLTNIFLKLMLTVGVLLCVEFRLRYIFL